MTTIRAATVADAEAVADLARQLGHPEADTALAAANLADAELAALVVADSARGHGVGKALLAAVERWAHDAGFPTLVIRSNVVRARAHRFYLREGCTENKRQVVFVKNLPAD